MSFMYGCVCETAMWCHRRDGSLIVPSAAGTFRPALRGPGCCFTTTRNCCGVSCGKSQSSVSMTEPTDVKRASKMEEFRASPAGGGATCIQVANAQPLFPEPLCALLSGMDGTSRGRMSPGAFSASKRKNDAGPPVIE